MIITLAPGDNAIKRFSLFLPLSVNKLHRLYLANHFSLFEYLRIRRRAYPDREAPFSLKASYANKH
jgi:hypothetical protein